ncbi:LRIG3 [Branchiostoma lanceolatum]|uniref:LRIG3 protein n=1 Tax=Branchiostoma lanceolatum TaxID=7740 RepID=A0A8J9ZE89_BRALA|nr:LRIG3 [Branchiostoma lanceolatum]
MLFLLLLAAACAASNDPGFPLCRAAGWEECVPFTLMSGHLLHRNLPCVMCGALNEGVGPGGTDPFSLLTRADGVAIRGYPFHVLSAKTLAPLDSSVTTLALIDAKITVVENNTFVGFVGLEQLSLHSNRLTNVKETWFTGLENLVRLILSSNNIKLIEPGSFMHLTHLNVLELENNLLQVVDPAWLFGFKGNNKILNLRFNEINSISPGSFQHLKLNWLDLTGNDLSCLDRKVLWGQSDLLRFHVSSGMLSSVHDAEPHGMMWGLHRLANWIRRSATLVVEVPEFLFCARHNGHELSFGWMFDSSNKVTGNIDVSLVNPGRSCGALDSSLTTISIQTPVVVLATDGSLTDTLVPNTLEQCKQVWEYHGGIAVVLVENTIFRLVSLSTGNATFEGVGMTFVQSQDTETLTESEYSPKHTTHSNATHDKNITCILIAKDEHRELSFTLPPVQRQTHTTATTYRADTVITSTLTHYSEQDHTPSEQGDNSTLQVGTAPGPKVPPTTDHVLISVVASAVVSLVVSSIVVLAWKLCAVKSNAEDGRASDDAHIWTIPPGVAFPGLLRSASLPACSDKMASDDAASCRSLPAALQSIEPTYCEIPEDIGAAQRPLPGLPQREIPDDAISVVARSSSLPAVTCTRGGAEDDSASCRSLPAVLLPIEPAYSLIPDHLAIAQRPLPALPRTHWEIPDNEAAAQLPLPAPPHTYSEIPDDESGPMPFYADPAEFSLHVVTNRRLNRRAFRDNTTATCSRQSGRSIAPYGSAEQTKAQSNSFYRKAPEVQGIRARRNLRTALASHASDQGVRTYVNVTNAIPSRGQNVTEAHIAFLTNPDAHLPWEIPVEGTHITPRRVSFPLVTPPNTYWPWKIPGEGTRNTPRHESLPHVTPPNTYWPWEIPGEGTRNTPRRKSLPLVTLPNTYWPWEIPGEGTSNTPRRKSLPLVTLPNTYWPWKIPGEGTRNTPRHESLPHVTPPNTYWPWEIPGEGTRNTPRRKSLPLVTLPNTYWPWKIPGEGTRNTPRHESLPHVTPPNTYWPWEIPGEGTRNTPRRKSLPLVTLPNTYWPWEIPGEGTRNTPRHESLPHVTPPNTYWPWEIPGEGTRNTPRRKSLPLVTLPNTYWPWKIPGEGTRNTPRHESLPHVTPPNTYWPWEIPGEGTRNTPRRKSLPLVTLPNTYWPWEIPGEGTRNTPRRKSLPLVTLPNTYWPWEIPGEGTSNTPRRTSLPLVTPPNTYWSWEIPGERTRNT